MEKKNVFLQGLENELHDLCQPLTTLQCRLELGRMCGDEVSMMEAIDGGLMETMRLFDGIGKLRERLLREMDRVGDGPEEKEG